jgi:hypothetical protein
MRAASNSVDGKFSYSDRITWFTMWTTPVQVGIFALTTFGRDSVFPDPTTNILSPVFSLVHWIVTSSLLAITTPLSQKFMRSSANNSASGTAWYKRTSISVSISVIPTVEGRFLNALLFGANTVNVSLFKDSINAAPSNEAAKPIYRQSSSSPGVAQTTVPVDYVKRVFTHGRRKNNNIYGKHIKIRQHTFF